ncbi:MAG TPA: single-stranded-DNA-specific exonuclease RecJ, partial [Chitinophagaceae bacterium]|nr:single-stranded-DNA-specific exonuclease RecJ [Chitinophagaceae bacterium]
AVERILTAMAQHEKILIFGDYDVDGTTAVACMYKFLQKSYDRVGYYIPHRYKEGYGISKLGIDYAKNEGYTLIIALDCGIKSVDLIRYASEIGIDFIVCDHHLPDETLPPAVAILNPKQPDCSYPYKELCGCGVGFKLMTALAQKLNLPSNAVFEFLDLLATAIAADIVPMTGENRIMAYYGLQKVNENPNPGIKALFQLSGYAKQIHINNLVFIIAPRVNAAGRMDDATKAVQLFTATTEEEALHFAEELHSDNTERKDTEKTITEEALAMIKEDDDWATRKSTLVYQPHWHKGVVGIVASRLIEEHYRPTIVLTKSGNLAAGSARSVVGFNLYEAIHACKECLIGYGGHFAAAGMTLAINQVQALKEKFETVVAASILPDQLVPVINIDTVISFNQIKQPFFDILSQMEPFGPENLRPVFITKKVKDNGWSKIVKENHIKFALTDGSSTLHGIGFNMAEKFPLLKDQNLIDIVYTIEENEWNDKKSLQLKVIDFRPAE